MRQIKYIKDLQREICLPLGLYNELFKIIKTNLVYQSNQYCVVDIVYVFIKCLLKLDIYVAFDLLAKEVP